MSSEGIKLTEKEMRYISLFQAYTGSTVRDCVEDENQLIFVVDRGEMAKAIGKRGSKIQELSDLLKKRIKVIEYSDDATEFIINALKPAQVKQVKITEKPNGKNIAVAQVDPADKGMTIGRGGKNIELIRQIVKRHHDIDHIIIQ